MKRTNRILKTLTAVCFTLMLIPSMASANTEGDIKENNYVAFNDISYVDSQKTIYEFPKVEGYAYYDVSIKDLNNNKMNIDYSNHFKDTANSPYKDSITFLKNMGIVKGYSTETFNPRNTLRQRDVIRMLGRSHYYNKEVPSYDAEIADMYNTTDDELVRYLPYFLNLNEYTSIDEVITRGDFALIFYYHIQAYMQELYKDNTLNLVKITESYGFEGKIKTENTQLQPFVNALEFIGITRSTSPSQFNDSLPLTREHFSEFFTRAYYIDYDLIEEMHLKY